MQEAKAAQAMTASAEQQRRALEVAQARAVALASELTGTRREIEAQAAQSQKAVDAATKQKQAAESTIAELRQTLEQEQKKTATLMQETKAAQATTASAEQQRRALEEARARAAALASELAGTRREMESWDVQSRKAEDAAAQQKQAAEREIAELRQSLQQEPDRAEAMARDLASARRPIDERVTVQRAVEGPIVPVTQPVAATVTEPPDVREKAEAARLLARAGSLIARGNIGAARVVLERAGESGNARASFMLAETYDPAILLAWGTYGTRGDAAKARELYRKAHAGGIQEAKDRLSALRQ
jgi:chromosome segregation ATPase